MTELSGQVETHAIAFLYITIIDRKPSQSEIVGYVWRALLLILLLRHMLDDRE